MRRVRALSVGLPVAVLLLTGCVPSAGPGDLKRSYPDRQLFHFHSNVAGGEMSYLCAPGETAAATKARAAKAHGAYEAEIGSYGDTFAQELVGALKSGAAPSTATRKVNRESDAWARKAALKIEAEYQCLPVAAPGVGLGG
ncbi:hypothetical protein [Thioclava pacifica]|uniref:Lipoprotein n=1 Tax=Thioclava pacifica DSM 10166 TaxID=1353537 RepID=A0A074JTY3_9RHOB|nr:hypothetical protein [Thioclava pacifica]KEO52817.1 hypothetical protein TP2_07705 [Thioclava pacifica DSM 10166]